MDCASTSRSQPRHARRPATMAAAAAAAVAQAMPCALAGGNRRSGRRAAAAWVHRRSNARASSPCRTAACTRGLTR
eukprot:2513144-Prymnesium_polylepis.1